MAGPELCLSGEQIDEIASGQPGSATLALLRTGQAALRRTLLVAAYRHVGEPGAAARALIGRAAGAAREPVEEIVTRPFAHDWGLRVLAAPPEEALRELNILAAAVALRAGIDLDVSLTAPDGELFLPGAGLADGLHCATIAVRQTGGAMTLGCPHPGVPPPRWSPVRTLAVAEDWNVVLEDQEPRRITLGQPRAITPSAVRAAEQLLRPAWSAVEAVFPGYAPTVRHLLRTLSPLAGDGSAATSSSSPVACGCVALDLGVPIEIAALLLIHETQHSLLTAAEDLTPLCGEPGGERFRAPWKHTPRPAPAMLQGVFAHAAVIDYWLARRHADPDDREALWQFAYLREVTVPAMHDLRPAAALTAAGRRLLDGLIERGAAWSTVDVPADVADLARRAGTAEATRWRLANLRPADGEAELLATAYLAGAGRPTPAAPRREGQAPPPPAPGGVIGRLHAAGRGHGTVPDHPDLTEALESVGTRPTDDEAWIVLATAAGAPRLLAERPDLVRETLLVMRARQGPAAPPADRLAAWLSGGE
ncbi:HEXXH motif-containing putative peptide modification protein [Actinoplanes sp. NPDC051851]|uniref:aKG-HExxH-type peptide beta-hydroxylase n=1 Tax=Actinoplanes sp. NPDC051851 TaxID=3154753 RepID=UPI00344863C2